jgi:hypothetical protein
VDVDKLRFGENVDDFNTVTDMIDAQLHGLF